MCFLKMNEWWAKMCVVQNALADDLFASKLSAATRTHSAQKA
jgi:hypothetical protein